MFYSQKRCPICKKIVVGESPCHAEGADSILGELFKAHLIEHWKDEGKEFYIPKEQVTASLLEQIKLRRKKIKKGKVSFCTEKGWGFVTIEKKGKKYGSAFFHISDLMDSQYHPQQNDRVKFETVPGNNGKEKAVKIMQVLKQNHKKKNKEIIDKN